MSAGIERAALLIQQGRSQDAEEYLRQALTQDPENGSALTLLAHCLVDREKYEEAQAIAGQAIALEPDFAFAHCVLAQALHGEKRFAEAFESIREAIRLEPEEADYHGILASFHMQRKDWESALEAAQQGLVIDPECSNCINARARSLVQLGRADDATETLDAALKRDPENAHSHASQGWVELNRGNYRNAFQHFREALRLQPDMEFARTGLLHALRATSPVYRPVLKFFLMLSKMTGRSRWMLFFGLILGARLLRTVAKTNPDLAPFVWPVLIVYLAFVYLTWTAPALHNVFLRFHPLGRLALSKDERIAATLAGICFFTGIAAMIWSYVEKSPTALLAGGVLVMIVIPLGGSFNTDPGNKRKFLLAYTALLFVIGMAGAFTLPQGFTLLGVFLLGTVAFTWIAAIMHSNA